MFSPGEGYPSEITTPTSSPTSSPRPSSDTTSLSSGAIAGIVIGGIVMIALVGVLCLIYRRKKKRSSYSRNTPQGSPSYIPQSPLKQNLEVKAYPTIYSPPVVSPEQTGFQSLLGSPPLNQFSPETAPNSVPQR
jgi:hypothetical protein